MKPTDPAAAAKLLGWAIDYLTRHPALRRVVGINLADLAEAGRVRRQLLKQQKTK